jgi:hypothetical protein
MRLSRAHTAVCVRVYENESVIAQFRSSVGCEVRVYISSAKRGCEARGVKGSTT